MKKIEEIEINHDLNKKFIQIKYFSNQIPIYESELNDVIKELQAIQKEFNKIKYKPIETGQTYKTKVSENYDFKVEEIDGDTAWGYYTDKEHLGKCPLPIERLIPERL